LRCGNQGEVNAVPHKLAWEKWTFARQNDGSVCIVNNQFKDKHVRMYRAGGDYYVNQQTYCGSWERFTFHRIEDNLVVFPGHYRVFNNHAEMHLTNVQDTEVRGHAEDQDVWNIVYEGSGVYTLQSQITNKFLAASSNSDIHSSDSNDENTKWLLEEKNGKICIKS